MCRQMVLHVKDANQGAPVQVLQRAVAQLETCLLLEAAMPGSDDVIACAALSSLAALACLPPLASDLISR